ncbi:MAG TPA: SET domain-containing protein-lysine N-methyltransferase [Pyrinomonadaceae bacterium]|nr:SET domain-containing protein-lysine N-methyltransferase [Pyrinomonadaceae bacterium]
MSGKLCVRKSRIYGRGCFALVRFPARKKIATFSGETLRGRRRVESRLRRAGSRVITIGDDFAIDGAVGGDATAFINHSCEPNAFMRAVAADKVAFFALRDIEPGEEITIDYKDPDHPAVCRCGAEQCRSDGGGRRA